jgi:hypothetical protein
MIDIVESYRTRKYVDDLEYIKDKLGGIEAVLEGLDVKYEEGISTNSLEARL